MKVYLSGPITSSPGGNTTAFDTVAKTLREEGHIVVSPVEMDKKSKKPVEWQGAMKRDINALMEVDAVVVLPNWVYSKGAVIEIGLARDLGIPVLGTDLKPFQEPITRVAERIVYGQRQEDYAPPEKNFERIAKLWSVILDHEVDAKQVGLCMIALKMSREQHKHSPDNLVDIVGYSECIRRVEVSKSNGVSK